MTAFTERPRPDYIYGLTLSTLVVLGLSIKILAARFGFTRLLAPVAVIAFAVLLVPGHYRPGPRPLHAELERLKIARDRLRQPRAVLLASRFGLETCFYLAVRPNHACAAPAWGTVRSEIIAEKSVGDVLSRNRISVIYVDQILEEDPLLKRFLAAPRAAGWRYVARGRGSDGRWGVLLPTSVGR